jgi:hypothetical protein
MKRMMILGLAVLLGGIPAGAVEPGDFSARGMMFQLPPAGHVVGKDNGPGLGLHHAGEECGICHNPGREAEFFLWTVAGTLYADRAGSEVLAGGEIVLQDWQGNVISLTSNEVGNFWTDAPIAANPYAVSSGGGVVEMLYVLDELGNLVQPADPDDPRAWQYKAWVKKGNSTRPMLTIAPVAGRNGMRMSCGTHHAAAGLRGALWVSSEPALPAYPDSGLGYRRDIFPILRGKCAPCHVPGGTMTRPVTKSDLDDPTTSLDFSNALDLTSYEGSSVGGVVKRGLVDAVNPSDPAASPVLRKTRPGAVHGGGVFWNVRDSDYLAIKRWIAEGARPN